MIKLALYGKSASGKSTVAEMVREYFNNLNKTIEIIKFAEPLYYLQNEVYKTAGVFIEYYKQDQKMLEQLCDWMRIINPKSLVYQFDEKLKRTKADVIINDDVRDVNFDFPFLKDQGFIAIKICCDEELRRNRLAERGDLSVVVNSKTTAQIDQIIPDIVIDTTIGDKEIVKNYVISCLNKIERGSGDI